MIPKKIHYCWFGGNPLDETSRRCIASWKTHFPDYEIIQWDERNFDISQMKFMEQAYQAKKWAFVSDVARLLIIYQNGGIYFDTDVEVIRPFEPVLTQSSGGFFAYENLSYINTGLGFAMPAGHPVLKELLELYDSLDFNEYRERLDEIACPVLTTQLLQKYGFVREDRMQNVCGIDIYPTEYFSPMDYTTGLIRKTQNTYTIHWYNASWNDDRQKQYRLLEQRCIRMFGRSLGVKAAGVFSAIRSKGLTSYFRRHFFRSKD